jgi:protein-S-isoprenylcysteine O-methyltransferase Ste14
MNFSDWLAAIVLFLQLPIPIYWFVLRPQVKFWRNRKTAAFLTAGLGAWGVTTSSLIFYHGPLFTHRVPPLWRIVAGVAFLGLDIYLFLRAKHELGGARIVGATELSGGGEIVMHGIYSRIRHPRYLGSAFAVAGACLLAGTVWMWLLAALWVILTFSAILLEERELRTRFGAAYLAYAERVPRFFPRISRAALHDSH